MKEPLITADLVAQHGLTEEEYEKIKKMIGREPGYPELGMFSVMWSEHCSYKSSRKLLKLFPTKGPRILQGPGENAGIVDIGDGLACVFKMESHNHPSFIEPFQGAATGVGGILRDIFTMGARPIALLDSLRFGSPSHPKTSFLVEGVVSGIASYGNCMGIPTIGGETFFNSAYNGNILVNVFALGLAKKEGIFRGVAEGVGNPVLYVGSKTGRDGIHGATMASGEFDETTEAKRPTVQVGDPFTEKLLLEACLEVMEKNLIVGIQDMGAAGLTCSSVEMAGRAGTGIELNLDKVPRRETGMTPYELLLSESQERMLLVAKKGCEDEVRGIFEKWDLDCSIVGRVMEGDRIKVTSEGKTVVDLPVTALTDEAPVYDRPRREPEGQADLRKLDTAQISVPSDLKEVLSRLLATPALASKLWIYRQYDHMVRTNTVVLPGSDAAVLRIKGTKKGIAISSDCNGRYCYLDPEKGAKLALAEAARNVACSGALPLAITDCLNFGNPEKPEVMWQFERAVKGLAEACEKLGTPVVGGNVSFYNETDGTGIFPTPTVVVVGLIEDVEKRLSQWFKKSGDVIVLLGANRDEIGGSEYLAEIHGIEKGEPPAIDLVQEAALQRVLVSAASDGLLSSAHDTSEGGLAVALAEACMTGPKEPLGARIELSEDIRPDSLLFGESASRVIVSLPRHKAKKLDKICNFEGVPYMVIGSVGGSDLLITNKGKELLKAPVGELKRIWEESFILLFKKK